MMSNRGTRPYFVMRAPTDEPCQIAEAAHLAILSRDAGARIGRGCNLGQNVYIGPA